MLFHNNNNEVTFLRNSELLIGSRKEALQQQSVPVWNPAVNLIVISSISFLLPT